MTVFVAESDTAKTVRLDKWLWHARFVKTRSLVTKLCQSARIRINDGAVVKPHHPVKPGDVLTFPLGPNIRVVKIIGLGTRRGPAPEARELYEDLAPPQPRKRSETANNSPEQGRTTGAGRPTKADRRAIDQLMGRES